MDNYSILLLSCSVPLLLLYAISTWQEIKAQKRRFEAQTHDASVKSKSSDDTP